MSDLTSKPGQDLESDPGAAPAVGGMFADDNAAGMTTEEQTGEFTSLDSRVVGLWRITHLIGTGILLGLLLIPALIISLNVRAGIPWVFGLWLAVAALRFWLLYWYPARAYESWGYRMDQKVLETRSGIWWRKTHLLPLSRLQHVDLNRGPLERAHGLASLVLHTAGTHDASLVIPGLDADEAVRLRDQLVAVGGDDGV